MQKSIIVSRSTITLVSLRRIVHIRRGRGTKDILRTYVVCFWWLDNYYSKTDQSTKSYERDRDIFSYSQSSLVLLLLSSQQLHSFYVFWITLTDCYLLCFWFMHKQKARTVIEGIRIGGSKRKDSDATNRFIIDHWRKRWQFTRVYINSYVFFGTMVDVKQYYD